MDDHWLGCWWGGMDIGSGTYVFEVDTFSRCVHVVCGAFRLCGGSLCSSKS